jgi:membrane-bound lytic murein transglycosylase D
VNSKPETVTPQILDYAGSKVYLVQSGDTLWDISKKFDGLTIEKIKELNNLTSNKITPGQKLIIQKNSDD